MYLIINDDRDTPTILLLGVTNQLIIFFSGRFFYFTEKYIMNNKNFDLPTVKNFFFYQKRQYTTTLEKLMS